MTNKLKLRTCMLISSMLIFFINTNSQGIGKKFNDLNSLVGLWSMETKKGFLYETWERTDDSTYTSKSFKLNGPDTIILEQVVLVRRGDRILYKPTVQDQNDQKQVAFSLLKVENNTYTFENKEHDFPQRIIYVLPQNNLLHAWIEGEVNGQFKKSDYNFKKVK